MDRRPPHRPAPPEAVFDESPSEHIQLASDDFEPREPRTEIERLELRDPWHGTRLELTLYAEDVLTVRRLRRGEAGSALRLDLRHFDTSASFESRAARAAWRTAGAAASLAALALLARGSGLAVPGIAWLLAAAGATATAALLLALYGSRRSYVFATLHGRAPALRLTARWGSFKRCRHIAERIEAAIVTAQTRGPWSTRSLRLKAEMREHYRLQQAGVISGEQCAASTARILGEFG